MRQTYQGPKSQIKSKGNCCALLKRQNWSKQGICTCSVILNPASKWPHSSRPHKSHADTYEGVIRMSSDQAKQTGDQVSAFTAPPHEPVINQALLCITTLLIKVLIWTGPKACAPSALAYEGATGICLAAHHWRCGMLFEISLERTCSDWLVLIKTAMTARGLQKLSDCASRECECYAQCQLTTGAANCYF